MDENDVKNLADLYWGGLQDGLENGKYISFSQWFYEFYKDIFSLGGLQICQK